MFNKIYSITVSKDGANKKSLLVSLSGGRVFQCKLSSNENTDMTHESNSSSSSSLSELAKNQSHKLLNRSISQPVEEIINFFSEINSVESQQRVSFSMPSYLVTNVQYNKCDQYSFLVTTNGDIFFFKMSSNLSRTPIWHRNLAGLVVMNYYKCDINVRL